MVYQLTSGRRSSFVALVLALGGFVAQTQLTHQVLTVMNYNRPFFVIYVTQSVFTVSGILHLLYLAMTTRMSISSLCRGLQITIAQRLRVRSSFSDHIRFPYGRFLFIAFTLTAGFTTPTLLWCIGISLSSKQSLTRHKVIWNTNAFFAYLISVAILGHQHQHKKFAAVVLATVGVVLVVYGGNIDSGNDGLHPTRHHTRLVGDLLALLASILYAVYQLFYDAFIEPPLNPLPILGTLPTSESMPLVQEYKDAIYPPPYGLESSFWTSMIGLCTMSLLWIVFPVLQSLGVENFSLPDDSVVVLAILGAALSGAMFMTGTMILLASWGAITTSITSLLTIVLVFLTDWILGATISTWSIIGSFVTAFAMIVLSYSSPATILIPATQELDT
ncbi:hypothetical protein EV360DRAFT_70136 [Lentinula raphanica]|nr:hypothetical protein EV360DRAFT_70136 [Lentinula raphanica]